jgi:hypothetical protein
MQYFHSPIWILRMEEYLRLELEVPYHARFH